VLKEKVKNMVNVRDLNKKRGNGGGNGGKLSYCVVSLRKNETHFLLIYLGIS
jgi:hypothetical protein